jgi:hypothetical protein
MAHSVPHGFMHAVYINLFRSLLRLWRGEYKGLDSGTGNISHPRRALEGNCDRDQESHEDDSTCLCLVNTFTAQLSACPNRQMNAGKTTEKSVNSLQSSSHRRIPHEECEGRWEQKAGESFHSGSAGQCPPTKSTTDHTARGGLSSPSQGYGLCARPLWNVANRVVASDTCIRQVFIEISRAGHEAKVSLLQWRPRFMPCRGSAQ